MLTVVRVLSDAYPWSMYMLIMTLAPLPSDVDVVMLVEVEPAATESIV